ncbi:MAG: DUF4785 family protein [Gammaproteobacteria bacterium]|nr:DUF4785 family protein [Gammaproteobacteria bacterium]
MNYKITMIGMALVTSMAFTASANEPRNLELEDRVIFNKIGVQNPSMVQPSFQPRAEPNVRDFEPRVPGQIRAPFLNKSVSFSFPVTDAMPMDFSEKQAHSQSRQYRMEVTGKELRQGVSLKTTAPGALVRISGFNTSNPVEPQNLNLHIANQKFAKGSAFDTLVDSRMMTKTGVGFQQGTTGFKISEQVGNGHFKLQTEQSLADSDRYLVNVFEKNSDVELHLTANKSSYLKGGLMTVNTALWDQGSKVPLSSVKSSLISPNGERMPLVANKSGQMQLPMNMRASNVPGALWTLETEVDAMINGVEVKRIAKVAFAYADKTATLSKMQPLVDERAGRLSAMIPVHANKQGRYEVRGVLYATNADGKMIPAMVTHSANSLNPGVSMINMQFDKNILAAKGLSAPFALKNLQLRDQLRMAVLETK